MVRPLPLALWVGWGGGGGKQTKFLERANRPQGTPLPACLPACGPSAFPSPPPPCRARWCAEPSQRPPLLPASLFLPLCLGRCRSGRDLCRRPLIQKCIPLSPWFRPWTTSVPLSAISQSAILKEVRPRCCFFFLLELASAFRLLFLKPWVTPWKERVSCAGCCRLSTGCPSTSGKDVLASVSFSLLPRPYSECLSLGGPFRLQVCFLHCLPGQGLVGVFIATAGESCFPASPFA